MLAGFNRWMGFSTHPPILIELTDLRATREVARAIAGHLRPGDTIVLEGPLGAGKTSFSRELLYALGVDEEEAITSPSFALVHEYEGRGALIHADLYRVEYAEELGELGLDEMSDGGAISLIEWGRRFEAELRGVIAIIELDFAESGESERRRARVYPRSSRGVMLADSIASWSEVAVRRGFEVGLEEDE